MKRILFTMMLVVLAVSLVSCGNTATKDTENKNEMNAMKKIAETYVKLCFQLGKSDPYYIDAYFGPEELKKQAQAEEKTLPEIIKTADSLLDQLQKYPVPAEPLEAHRHRNLVTLVKSLKGRAQFVSGKKMTFDEESRLFYDAVAPSYPPEHYEEIIKELDQLLPGKAPLSQRVNDFTSQFNIPSDKLEAVFKVAIDEARKRSHAQFKLPDNERFRLEYVKDKPWGAYNWFLGNGESLIQVNTDFPLSVRRAIGLACHEGYPGHHVYYLLVEEIFYKGKGWLEYSLYPLFSPLSLLAEGTANFGIEVAFPGEEREKFEKEVLFPLAGLSTEKADLYYKVLELTGKLRSGGNDIGRLFLDGKIDKEEAVNRLVKYQLRTKERSEKYLEFIERYRSYIINYTLGEKMVRDYVEKLGGTADNPKKRWKIFKKMLHNPILPGDLK